jgi:hypothetical protein
MLPAFPKAQKASNDLWDIALKQSMAGGSVLVSDMKHRSQKEGQTARYETIQGERKTIDYAELKVDVSPILDALKAWCNSPRVGCSVQLSSSFGSTSRRLNTLVSGAGDSCDEDFSGMGCRGLCGEGDL